MKFQCKKSDISLNLSQAQNIVGQRTTLQILSNILIEANQGKLTFSSTDLEIGMHSSCLVDVQSEGKTTIPARKFFDIIRNLPDETITIETDDQHSTKITCGKSFYRVFGMAPEDFPQLPDFSEAKTWEIPQGILKTIIKRTNFAISRDESRYVLNGINLIFKKDSLTGVATDGRRLSLSKHSNLQFENETEFIIPAKTVGELTKLLGEEGPVTISHKGNQVSFDMGTTVLITKLIEGNFPEYQAVIPQESPKKITFDKKQLSECIQRVSILTSEKSNSIKFSFSGTNCVIHANSPSFGEAREELEIEYEGEDVKIAFNPAFIMDILKCLSKDKATIEISDSLKPGMVRESDEFLSVIMPMRLTD